LSPLQKKTRPSSNKVKTNDNDSDGDSLSSLSKSDSSSDSDSESDSDLDKDQGPPSKPTFDSKNPKASTINNQAKNSKNVEATRKASAIYSVCIS